MGIIHIMNNLGFRSISACSSNNCNAPDTVVYVPVIATLVGYTVSTFGVALRSSPSAPPWP